MNKDPYRELKHQLSKSKDLIYFDIETAPMLAWIWSLGKQYVSHEQIFKESKVISIQWMFEGDTKVSYLTWDKNQNDRKMLEKFSKIMRKARVAVTQNGESFDHKVLRWRLNLLRLTPLRNVEIIDVLKLSRNSFRPPSHKLDYRSKVYGFGGKIHVTIKNWIAVILKVPGALEKLVQYGCKDVPDLRKILWRELPYYVNIPVSLAMLVGGSREFCSRCASQKQRKFDVYPTKVGNKNMMECKNCGNLWKETRVSRRLS